MKQWIATILLAGFLAADVFAAAKGPEIAILDNKVSISAEAIPLSRLLRLLDRATGLKSTVPPELANRNFSVRFSGLSFDDAVRKIFQGQSIDYVVIEGQGIIVTAASQSAGGPDSPPAPYNANAVPAAQQVDQQPFFEDNQAVVPGFAGSPGQGFPGAPAVAPNNPFNQQQQQLQQQQQQQQQPAMIQTPFGPIPNPRANQQTQPAQQNPFGAVPSAPFGNGTPFGTAAPTGQTNDVFGNTSPPLFNPNSNPVPKR